MRFATRKSFVPAGFTNVLDYIDPQYHREILARTSTHDFTSDISPLLVSGARLYFPGGTYTFSTTAAAGLLLDGLSNVVIRGEQSHGLSNGLTVFKALNGIGTSRLRCAILELSQTTYCAVLGITLDRSNTAGDCLYTGDNDYLTMRDIQCINAGAITQYILSANSGTDVFTRGTSLGAWAGALANGDRVELWVGSVSGDALPTATGGDLAKDTAYYVRDVSGTTFKLARTLGGAAIDITSNGSGHWGVIKGCHTIDSINTGTDTVTIANHGWSDGQRIWSYQHDTVGTDWAMAAVQAWAGQRGYNRYVINKTTDTFQVSGWPNSAGGAVDITGTLGSNKPKLCAVWRGWSGGGNLYMTASRIYFSNCQQGSSIQYYESSIQARPYGANASSIRRLVSFCGGHQFGGNNLEIRGGTHEARLCPPNPAHFLLQDGVATTPVLDGVYLETSRGSAPTREVICNSLATVENVEARGPHAGEVGSSFGFSPGVYACRWGRNNRSNGHESGVQDQHQYSVIAASFGGMRPMIFDGLDALSTSETGTVDGYIANAVRSGTSLVIGRIFRRYIGWEFLGSIIQELRQSVSNSTEIDLALGNIRQLEGSSAHTIDTVKTAGVAGTTGSKGWRGELLVNNPYVTLSATKFATLSGADYSPVDGENFSAAVDGAGKIRLIRSLGSVVARTPTGLQGNLTAGVSAQNLFSAAPTPGNYVAYVYVKITASATAGTLAIILAYDDGSAHTEQLFYADTVPATPVLVKDIPLVATGGYMMIPVPFRVASGTPSIATSISGLVGGPPTYVLDIEIARVG